MNFKPLLTRRSIGFLLALISICLIPSQAEWIVALYSLLVGAAIADTVKGR